MKRLTLLLMLLSFAGIAHATVPAVPYTVTFNCTGGFGPFPFTFPISAPVALTVQLNGVTLASTSYTLTPVNANFNNGGKVLLGGSFPCNSGSTLVLTRNTPITQTTNFYDNMPSLPIITGSSVDKLTEIAQELQGLIGQIATHNGVTSIQMQNNGVNYDTPLTGIGTLNFVNCTVTGTSPSFTITCTGGGGGSAFSAITSGTNTTAAMVVGSGATLDLTGTGTINANKVLARALTGFTGNGVYLVTATGTLAGVNGDPICQDGSGNIKGSGCPSISGPTLQTNGVNNTSQTTLNFINPSAFNGLTFTFSNPSTGNETFAVGGQLNSSGMTSLVSPGSCTSCNVTFDSAGRATGYSNGSGGGGTVGSGTTNGTAYYTAPTTTGSTTPPTVNGQYTLGYTVTGGVSVPPTARLVGLQARGVSGSSDTILYSDANNIVEYAGVASVAVALPTPTTLNNSNFYVVLYNLTTGSSTSVTVTPATWTINGGATLVIATGQKCVISVDPNTATNWIGACTEPPIIAGTNVTVSRTAMGVTVNSSGAGTRAIQFPFGSPGGTALVTGILGYVTVPFGCTITGWSIEADAGTATVKFLKIASGTAVPTIANSINTSGVALSSGTVVQSTTLSDFTTTTITANDIMAADLITTSGVGYINAQVKCQ